MKRKKKRYGRRAFCLGRRQERVQNVRAGQNSVVIDDDVTALTATVNGGRIKCPWKVVYTEDEDDINSGQEKTEKGYTLPEYAFTVECSGAESEESGQLDVRGGIKAIIKNKSTKQPLRNKKISLWCGIQKIKEMVTDENGYIELIGIELGKFTVKQKEEQL